MRLNGHSTMARHRFDASGTMLGAVLIFRDVSERRRAEKIVQEARAFAEDIVETIREPLVVLDSDLQ